MVLFRNNWVLPFIAFSLGIAISFDAVEKMVMLWLLTDTYMHGAFVIPLAAFMAYQKPLSNIKSQPSNWTVTASLTLLWGGLMMLGHLSMINVVIQAAIIMMVPLLVISLFGWKLAWYYRSSLVLLLFAIPVGDFLIPFLQSITADMAIYLLRLSDVSVLRNGWYISIAEANFRVAEACSGVNFLISTFTVTVFYAFTYMEKKRKRVAFILLGLLVPILANGLRVYLIIMIAELGYVEAATGFDHLVYGWIFFMFILVILFIIGHYWQDPLPKNAAASPAGLKDIGVPNSPIKVIPLVILHGIIFIFLSTMPSVNETTIKTDIYLTDPLGPSFPYSDVDNLIVNDTFRTYSFEYFSEGSEKKLISYENRWFNPKIWSIEKSGKVVIFDKIKAVRWDLKDLSGRHYVLYHSYYIGGNWVSGAINVKGAQALSKLLREDFGGSGIAWFMPAKNETVFLKTSYEEISKIND